MPRGFARARMGPSRLARAARARVQRRMADPEAGLEDGFSIPESMVALGILFIVLTGLLTTMSVGVKGVLTGRQRDAGASIAREVIEELRTVRYERVGHNLTDSTLTNVEDPAVSATTPKRYTEFNEVLADGSGASAAVPTHQYGYTVSTPVNQSKYTLDGTPYNVWIYITHVTGAGQAYKRATVIVESLNEQADKTVVENKTRLSTFIYPGEALPARILANVNADSGFLTYTGKLGRTNSTTTMNVWFPWSQGDLLTGSTTRTSGTVRSAYAHFEETAGGLDADPQCTATGGTIADCPSVAATTSVDDDSTATLPSYQLQNPAVTDGAVRVNGVWNVDWDGGTVRSEGSSCYGAGGGCGSPFGSIPLDPVPLPYALHQGDGPEDLDVAYPAIPNDPTPDLDGDGECDSPPEVCLPDIEGTLVRFTGAFSGDGDVNQNTSTNAQPSNRRTVAEARVSAPPVSLFTFDGAGAAGTDVTVVSIASASATARAETGPLAALPTCCGLPVVVSVLGVAPIPVTPGTASDTTVNIAAVLPPAPDAPRFTLSGSVRITTGQKTTVSTASGSTITEATASVPDWLVITVDLELTRPGGQKPIDGTLVLNYGDLLASGLFRA